MGIPLRIPMGVEIFGLVAGLGFVLSFGYWCTDFLVVQRAMAAESMSAARRTPLIAALPEDDHAVHRDRAGNRRAVRLPRWSLGYSLPLKRNGGPDYDQALTTLDGAVLSLRNARRRAHRADGVFHVRHGRQCHRVQHRLDLRYLSGLHPPERAGLALSPGRARHHRRWRRALARAPPISPATSTTSWIFCSSCSDS